MARDSITGPSIRSSLKDFERAMQGDSGEVTENIDNISPEQCEEEGQAFLDIVFGKRLPNERRLATENIDNISDEDCQAEAEAFLKIAGGGQADEPVEESHPDTDEALESFYEAKKLAKHAMDRTHKGTQYGADMMSSALLCYEDAVKVLQQAISTLNDAGVRK